jgi:hypothetical protein
MARNILIVESKNDQYFLEAVIKDCQISNIKTISISEEDWKVMNGLDAKKLEQQLQSIKPDIIKAELKGKKIKIGIVIDIDDQGESKKIEFINDCVASIFNVNPAITEVNRLFAIEFTEDDMPYSFDIGCHLTNVNGKGELETILKSIKNHSSIYADCLDSWHSCLKENDVIISNKDFDKFWINVYLRYDTCSPKEQKQAGSKCNFEAGMKKADIWDFNSPILEDLKSFLQMF